MYILNQNEERSWNNGLTICFSDLECAIDIIYQMIFDRCGEVNLYVAKINEPDTWTNVEIFDEFINKMDNDDLWSELDNLDNNKLAKNSFNKYWRTFKNKIKLLEVFDYEKNYCYVCHGSLKIYVTYASRIHYIYFYEAFLTT
jgi:hypothetical protein